VGVEKDKIFFSYAYKWNQKSNSNFSFSNIWLSIIVLFLILKVNFESNIVLINWNQILWFSLTKANTHLTLVCTLSKLFTCGFFILIFNSNDNGNNKTSFGGMTIRPILPHPTKIDFGLLECVFNWMELCLLWSLSLLTPQFHILIN
jgi:hypothetical protein